MSKSKLFVKPIVAGISVAAALFWVCIVGANATSPQGDIVDTAIAAGSFKTLVKALQAAELVDTLKGPGPFTVFAPTDDAFAKLPKGMLDDLLKPENVGKLRSVLTFHVVPGKLMGSQVLKLKLAKTVNGQEVSIHAQKGGKISVDNSTVTRTDIQASNGVIHVIDAVLMPK